MASGIRHQALGSIWVPDISVERVVVRFQEHLNENKLPLTVVAFCDGKPVGMCSLGDNDGIRPDLAPWLGSLVVHPEYQREGIAIKLINAIKQKAKQLGFSHLYLGNVPKVFYRFLSFSLFRTAPSYMDSTVL